MADREPHRLRIPPATNIGYVPNAATRISAQLPPPNAIFALFHSFEEYSVVMQPVERIDPVGAAGREQIRKREAGVEAVEAFAGFDIDASGLATDRPRPSLR